MMLRQTPLSRPRSRTLFQPLSVLLSLVALISSCGNEPITRSSSEPQPDEAIELGLTSPESRTMGSTAPCSTDPKIDSRKISMFARPEEPVEFFVQSSRWSQSFQTVISPPGQITAGHKIYSSRDCLIPLTIPWTGIDRLEMRLPQGVKPQQLIQLEKAPEKIGEKPQIQLLRFQMTKRLGRDSLSIAHIMPLQNGTYTLSMPKTAFKFDFRVLSGDADNSYNVDQQDDLLARKFIGQKISIKNSRFDIDGDGDINTKDIFLIRASFGQKVTKPHVQGNPDLSGAVREDFKVHLSDSYGKLVSGTIYASINGQTVTKVELNGKDAGITSVSGPVGTKIVWSNSLNSDVFETILDGKGDYDGRGHYVIFKVVDKPALPPLPTTVSEFHKVHINDTNGKFLPGIIYASINGKVVSKIELNGKDAGLVTLSGILGSKVLWTNNLNSDVFETILDGKGEYDGRGHYVIFKVINKPSINGAIREDFKVHLSDGDGKFVSGIIYASINGQTVTKVELNGKDAGITSVSGPIGTKIVWSNNVNSDVFETILDGKGDYDGRGHYVVFKVYVKPESGNCGIFFGSSARSFPSTREECFMKQEDIDTTCKNYSGQDYKVNWTTFNADSTIKEVLNLQNGVCQKLPTQPPVLDDNPDSPDLACGTAQSVEDPNATYSWASRLRAGEDLGKHINLFKYTNVDMNALFFDKSTLNFVCQINGFLEAIGGIPGSFYSPGNHIYLWNSTERRLNQAPHIGIGNQTIRGFSCKGKLTAQCTVDKSWIFKK